VLCGSRGDGSSSFTKTTCYSYTLTVM
jgi:hypothetical protein